jgi:hypothetical protein
MENERNWVVLEILKRMKKKMMKKNKPIEIDSREK